MKGEERDLKNRRIFYTVLILLLTIFTVGTILRLRIKPEDINVYEDIKYGCHNDTHIL